MKTRIYLLIAITAAFYLAGINAANAQSWGDSQISSNDLYYSYDSYYSAPSYDYSNYSSYTYSPLTTYYSSYPTYDYSYISNPSYNYLGSISAGISFNYGYNYGYDYGRYSGYNYYAPAIYNIYPNNPPVTPPGAVYTRQSPPVYQHYANESYSSYYGRGRGHR
jgi:hypothetical protein